ncbi:MAG: Gfo/Idh/MocA family oxidoreductase [Rhodopirellula sp.]|nr:Gfo/Idh/MocA family oxidoreductase [Rhodopirellula sp.]
MIQVGLVGVGPQWERFRPALSRLRQPIHVEAVYDPVFARAESAAKDLDADPVSGIHALAGRGNVEAILVMDPTWTQTSVLSLLARQEKPVFFAPWPFDGDGGLQRLMALQSNSDGLIVPAMWRRFLPAAIRLQELFATEIGQPREISIDLSDLTAATSETATEQKLSEATEDSTLETIVGWLDFCRNLFRAFPVSASACLASDPNGKPSSASRLIELTIEYPSVAASSFPTEACNEGDHHRRIAKLRLRPAACESATTATQLVQSLFQAGRGPTTGASASPACGVSRPRVPQIGLCCERGTAALNSATQITWQTSSPEPIHETLTADRSEEEIMLDIFCRRVVGGLVPVADLNDILKPFLLLRNCLET